MPKVKSKYHVRPDGTREASRIINGKRVTFYGKTDNEIERKMIAYKGEIERGRAFKDLAEEWKEVHFPTLIGNTAAKCYNAPLTRAIARFDKEPIRQIKAPDVKKYINEFSKKGYSRKTVANQLMVLSLIFSHAIENGDIEYNPALNISIPKNLTKEKRQAATTEDETRIKNSATDWLLPFLLLYTGLRRGEALALQYSDIDFENDEIRVSKSVYHVSDKPFIKKPKTEAGNRTVPLLAPLKRVLKKQKGEYIFSDDNGKTPLTQRRYRTLWSKYAEATGISCTAHQLRHSYATMLYEIGIDAKDAQNLLGHSTIAITQDIYTHLRENRSKEIAKKMNASIT